MSTETMPHGAGTDLDYPPADGDATESPPAETRHTQPSQREIVAAIALSDVMLGASKDGSACYDAWHVEEGVAFRPRGSDDATEYRWQRRGDFLRENDLLAYADGHIVSSGIAAVEALVLLGKYERSNIHLRQSIHGGYARLGEKGRRKFRAAVDPRLGRMLDAMVED